MSGMMAPSPSTEKAARQIFDALTVLTFSVKEISLRRRFGL